MGMLGAALVVGALVFGLVVQALSNATKNSGEVSQQEPDYEGEHWQNQQDT